jgi:hypothetical protein
MKHALLAVLAAALMQAQDLPTLAERNWFHAEPLFLSVPPVPAERAFVVGPAFTVDSNIAPMVSGRTWQPASRLRFSVETATYAPPRYRMVTALPTRDTVVAARFEFRF